MSAGKDYVPSHPGIFEVEFRPGYYCSRLLARKDFEAGEVMVYLTGFTRSPKGYDTLQCGPDPEDHVSQPSDLTYVNHSCDPNTAFNLYCPDRGKWHMYALKRISVGDPVTIFYPSNEWSLDRPFDCTCGAPSCLQGIEGAVVLSEEEVLARGAISPWITDAIRQRDIAKSQ